MTSLNVYETTGGTHQYLYGPDNIHECKNWLLKKLMNIDSDNELCIKIDREDYVQVVVNVQVNILGKTKFIRRTFEVDV